jgi:hypothetical protein
VDQGAVRRRLSQVVGRIWFSIAAALLSACVGTAAAPEPASEQRLAEQWHATAAVLAKRATEQDLAPLAALIAGWEPPTPADRIVVVEIPARLVMPEGIDSPAAEAIWRDFVAARRQRAEGLFALAVEAARSHAEGPAFAQRSCEAVRLLARALRDDPEHASAREAGGWVKRGERWVWPEVARRLDKGEVWSDDFGWLPRSRLARYQSGERYERGRWVRAADVAGGPRPLDQAFTFASDHWQIRSTADLPAAATLARDMEETFSIWLQVYGGFQTEPAGLERQFEGRGRPPLRGPFAAVLTADRQQYITEMGKLEPLIAQTLGIYWTPTRTSWFFVGEERTATTVHHEATHQLFGEMRKTSPLVGERCGFWAVEAAACFMESLQRTAWGWTLGGLDAGRTPAARERLLEDAFYVPLEELTALGRRDFQSRADLPPLYSQISGLADFFMVGAEGRYREAFVEYLVRIYTGSVDPDTLARLCKTDYSTLDTEYRRHLSR